jgi:CRP-like cAMP-binding protein
MHAFCDLDPLHIHKLALISSDQHFEEGTIIYRAGEVGQAIYLILEGEVAVEMEVVNYGPMTLFTLGPGQLFGWSSLFPSRHKQARARVIQPAQIIVINANRLRDLFRADHKMECAVMNCMSHVVVDRVRGARLELAKTLATDLKKRQ